MEFLEQIRKTYRKPLFNLISDAHKIHDAHHVNGQIQVCVLVNVKKGGCSESCAFCSQSSRYKTSTVSQPLLSLNEVLEIAEEAIRAGATRVCLAAAWRQVRNNRQFEEVLAMVSHIRAKGIEVCCTLGFIDEPQAKRLHDAGVYAYNHNLQTSEECYKTIVSTHTYQDRLKTLEIIKKMGISQCCGGILGLGETHEDRIQLLYILSRINPESLPINILEPIAGTPLSKNKPLSFWETLRFIATARILMPDVMLRLSSGRQHLTDTEQTLCFFAGVNAIFSGDTLLTVPNTGFEKDELLFEQLGLTKKPSKV